MVFSSIPAPYQLHDPPNWHQQQLLNDQENGLNNNDQAGCEQLLPSAPPPHLLGLQPHGGGGAAGFIKPGSMTERARLANIPIPETALPCPRCESTNTKFCYFNNYSLSQPRHFCKTCRRYWTRGGALRNVPVGGGCRRNNKRSKGGGSSRSGSKSSSATTGDQSSGTATITASTSSVTDILGLGAGIPPLRLMAPLQNLTHFTDADSIGLNYGSVSDQAGGGSGELIFPMGRAATGSSYFSGLDGQWRLTHQHAPQFPFMCGLDSSSGMFTLEGGAGPATAEAEAKMIARSRSAAPTDSVKLEEAQELNLSQQMLAMNNDNDNNRPEGNYQHYWNSSAGASAANLWTELSTNFSTSSTGNPV